MINLEELISEADDLRLSEIIVHALITLGGRGDAGAEVLQAQMLATMGSDKAALLEAGFNALNS